MHAIEATLQSVVRQMEQLGTRKVNGSVAVAPMSLIIAGRVFILCGHQSVRGAGAA